MGKNLAMARKLSTKTYNATDNTYESSSVSDSDESNASLLERSYLLSNKFMLPKDLCENGNIFNDFFSRTLWNTLPPATQHKLAKLLPVAKDDMPSATKVVHDLLSHELHRFGKEPMDDFRYKLANGNFRVDVAKLQHNLVKLTKKDRRMVELQRMSRLAPNVMLSREAVLYSELHSSDVRALPSTGRVTDSYNHRRQWDYDSPVSSTIQKCQSAAKKRYLSEIINICDEIGMPMTLSDEEDCMHALPTGTVRKQRRMVGSGSQSSEQSNFQLRPGLSGSSNGCTAGNTFDGTIFNAPKLFVVTEEHYRKLMLQHRKRKLEEPDHPELDLDNIKLKDVVSRTQIAAGYRRILPLPKVYISNAIKDNTTALKGKVKSQKSLKIHRSSLDQTDANNTFDCSYGEYSVDRAKVKSESTVAMNVKVEDEQPSSDCFDSDLNEIPVSSIVSTKQYSRSEKKTTMSYNEPATRPDSKKKWNPTEETKQEAIETLLTTVPDTPTQSTQPSSNASLPDAMVENDESTKVEQNVVNCLFSSGTHACFLAVVRDLFCSNPDHRSTLPELQLKLDAWTKSPVAERNFWFEQYRNNGEWNETLQSAVQFLAGEYLNQPEDFVPYIEHKVALNILQWIGASRDGDSRLVPLCAYWQSRKQEMDKPSGLHTLTTSNITSTSNSIANYSSFTQVAASPKSRSRSVAGSKHVPFSPSYSSSSSMSSVSSLQVAGDNSVSLFNDSTLSSLSIKTATVSEDDGSINERSTATPPPLFSTDWIVRKATDEEIKSFREQEKRRYENPHMAFTYKQHSYDSVVGPVKGIYTQAPGISKARDHSMLVANRPNFVTILTLVRDATARLPNGEGTRADICELLKSSQYISSTAAENVLQTIVSGALDRMHTERDPCVKYDAKRKIWIYLHRNRTKQEFERLHMQYQGFTKHKKSNVRKSLRQSKETMSTSNTSKHDLLNDSGTSVESFTLNSSTIEMDQESSAIIGDSAADSTISTDTTITITEIPTTSMTGTTTGKSSTSLLKKQMLQTTPSDNIAVQQPRTDDINSINSMAKSVTTDVNTPCQTDQTRQPICVVKNHQTIPLESSTDVMYKSSGKLCGAVTLISSAGNNVRTIQIPKSSLTLANTLVTSNTSTALVNETSTSDDVLSQDALGNINTKTAKKILVSAIVSSAKSTISPSAGANTKSVVDISRISNSKPILVQPIGTAASSHTPAACSFVSSPKDDIKIGSSIGGTIVSIRQVNSTSGISSVSQKNQILPCGQTTTLLSPQSSAHAKGPQLSINNASFASSSGGSALPNMKGGTVITATIGKPIYSSSVGQLPLKQATSSASIVQTNLPGTVFSQKMMVSSGRSETPSSGESSRVPTVVAIKSASTSNMTSATTDGINRIVKPATNLLSTITIAKGQQSVLTPAKQRQIIQNAITKNQKQSFTGNQIVSQAALLAASASSLTKVQIGDTKQQYKASPSYLVENQTSGVGFKINQNQPSSSPIKTLSPNIVKITPTRSKPQTSIRPVTNISTIVGSANTTVLPTSKQAASSVKMIKVSPSTILTSTAVHGMANAGTTSTGTAVAVTVSSNTGTITSSTAKNATMRVLKTATGSTTVIKTEVTRGPSVQQLSQSNAHHGLETLRKDPSPQVSSKLIVHPNINTGQLIPLESLLQKPGIGGTVNNSPGSVNTILKLTGTTKSGQQFIQFGTSANLTNSSTSKPTTNLSSASSGVTTVGSVAHQYTILPQTRNIISVASTSTTNRPTNLPLTIVSSSSESSETFQPGGSIIVSNKKGNLSEVNSSSDSPTAKLMQQGTKVKLLTTTPHNPNSFGSGPAVSASQQQSSGCNAKTSVPSTVNVSGEFLNAKIIGVRNITAAKLKGTSSLSLMNANALNIAHIGGKPVLIANNTTVGTNQGITVSAAKSGPSSAMLLTGNASCNGLVLGQQNASSVPVPGTSSTTGREIMRTNVVSGIPGQIQTVLLRNNVVKVQTMPPNTTTKLSHQQSIVSGTVSSSGINPVATTLIATAGRCTTAQIKSQLQQQQHQKSQKKQQTISTGGTSVILTPNIPPNPMTLGTTVGEETLSNSFIKLQSSNAEITNNAASVSQTSRVVITQPIIIPSDVQKSGSPINVKRLKVIPVNKQRNK
ncbi:mucin-12 [Anopheles marshallii]|uniref:mucin-12 n=1 Tax=Anopheles marshallii TaxID=1521116 RepID=UPI00237A2D79|nr:mucin-12 [Anopheles marshallii]